MLRMLAIASVVGLLASSAAGAPPEKAKKKKAGVVAGTVVEVKADAITVKLGAKKKKNAPADATGATKTFKVNSQTKVEKVTGAKKEAKAEPAKISDIAKDARVAIKANGDTAEEIKIRAGKGAKKKKKNT